MDSQSNDPQHEVFVMVVVVNANVNCRTSIVVCSSLNPHVKYSEKSRQTFILRVLLVYVSEFCSLEQQEAGFHAQYLYLFGQKQPGFLCNMKLGHYTHDTDHHGNQICMTILKKKICIKEKKLQSSKRRQCMIFHGGLARHLWVRGRRP